jgi:hypothetical protein
MTQPHVDFKTAGVIGARQRPRRPASEFKNGIGNSTELTLELRRIMKVEIGRKALTACHSILLLNPGRSLTPRENNPKRKRRHRALKPWYGQY